LSASEAHHDNAAIGSPLNPCDVVCWAGSAFEASRQPGDIAESGLTPSPICVKLRRRVLPILAVTHAFTDSRKDSTMSLGLILVIILVIFLLGGFSGRFGGYGYGYGHGGVGIIGTILIIIVILMLLGRI
jgi:Protein of unknown function (DUF3309)